MRELTKENYDTEVLETEKIVVVDFWGDTCVRCLQILPGMEELEAEFDKSVVFAKVNIKGNRRLAIREKVMSLPTVLIYKSGERVCALTGNSFSAKEVREKLTEVLNA